MPFSRMFKFVVETIAERNLFTTPILSRKQGPEGVGGPWVVNTDECVKMLCVYYFQLHRGVFAPKYHKGASQMFWHPEINGRVRDFAGMVTEAIWIAKGTTGKLNCPHFDALELPCQTSRCRAALLLVGLGA